MMEQLRRALMTLDQPSTYFAALPEEERAPLSVVYDLIGVPQSPKYHPEGDAFVHTMMVLDEAAALRSRAQRPFAFMLAALMHDVGKAVSTGQKENGGWHSIGHENTGARIIEEVLPRLGADAETTAYCASLCRLHMRLHTCYFGKAGAKATNRLFGECVCPQDLALLCACDTLGKGKPREEAQDELAFIEARLQRYLDKAAREDEKRI